MVEEIRQGEVSLGERMCGFWAQPSQIEHPCDDGVHNFFSYSKFYFIFGFLFMAHSLHVQMDFFIYGNFFLGLIRN
jgi:hypothetical protein